MMGWYVHIHVCFSANGNEAVAELARKHRPLIQDEDDGHRAVMWFLDDLSKRTGSNPGPKGGLSLWGMIGNYTKVDTFCEVLRPFWEDLLSGNDMRGDDWDGPCSHDHIIVFEEQEQSEAATAYEIGWDDNDGENRKLFIKKHERLPFTWMQS
jgi:hypothetical protein